MTGDGMESFGCRTMENVSFNLTQLRSNKNAALELRRGEHFALVFGYDANKDKRERQDCLVVEFISCNTGWLSMAPWSFDREDLVEWFNRYMREGYPSGWRIVASDIDELPAYDEED